MMAIVAAQRACTAKRKTQYHSTQHTVLKKPAAGHTTLLCRGGQPVDNSTRRVLLDLVHTVTLSEKKKKKKKKKKEKQKKKKNPARLLKF